MSILSIIALLGGFVLLVAGGEALVRGAGSLGRTIGMSSLIVGLTVVSFATSSPELAVSTGAAFAGSPGLAVGNVVGSNIANILFVLGLTAIFGALTVRLQLIRADIPVMIGFSVLLFLLALDGGFSTLDGGILLLLLLGYLVALIVVARRQQARVRAPETSLTTEEGQPGPLARSLRASRAWSVMTDLTLIGIGVVLLVAGAQLLVTGATDIAEAFGVSDLIIGLTVVAIGTSLPELATSIVAVLRGDREMAVGNLVGSNIFNVGAVIGLTAVVAPEGIDVDPAALHFDMPVMLATAMVLLPLAFTGQVIARGEGALMVALYSAYVAYLVLAASHHQALQPFSATMFWFVLPLTAVWIIAVVIYELRQRRRHGQPQPG